MCALKVEVWIDLVCPFCYIGTRQLELAIDQVPFKKHILIEYKSFEIDSNTLTDKSKRIKDILVENYNLSTNKLAKIVEQSKEIDLTFELDMLWHVNTFNAHRFLKYACANNKATEVVERLLESYFIKQEKLDSNDTFMKICEEFNFNKNEVSSLLQSNKFSRAVKYDQIEAEDIGIEHPPYFLINEEFALLGVQSVDFFKEALEVIWEQMGEKPLFTIKQTKQSRTTYCSGEDCVEDL